MKADFPSETAYANAAWLLMCDVNALKAVAKIEAGREGAFFADGEPVILFERHLFSRYTSRKFDGHRINALPWGLLSDATPGDYGPMSVQHVRLKAAVALDRDAALRAASWGLFQILGNNHDACGYPELQRFINAMYRGVDDHLRALVMFVRHDHRLVDALRVKDWASFARVYNGPSYAVHSYDKRLAAAFEEISR